MSEEKKEHRINIELPEDVADGVYSNLVIITHSPSEFVLDFINIMPGVPKPKVKRRIILTPQHTKRLLRALQENVAKYEQHFGVIIESEIPSPITPYSGPIAEA